MTPAPLTVRRGELASAVEAAKAERSAFRDRRKHRRIERFDAVEALTTDLRAYKEAIRFKRPDAVPEADRPEEERRLTDRFLEAVREGGFVLRAAGKRAVEIDVPHDTDADEQARFDRAVVAAERALDDFTDENAEGLRAEADKAEADRIRAALDSDDPQAIREAINGPDEGVAALTSDEVTGSGDIAAESRPLQPATTKVQRRTATI